MGELPEELLTFSVKLKESGGLTRFFKEQISLPELLILLIKIIS